MTEGFLLCLGCGEETVKKRRRLLHNDSESINVWSLLRRHYSVLLAQQRVRIAADTIHAKLTTSGDSDEIVDLDVYLCEPCWRILTNFCKKEQSINQSIQKALSLLPTVLEETSTCNLNGNEQNTESQGESSVLLQTTPQSTGNSPLTVLQSTPSRKQPRKQHPPAKKKRRCRSGVNMKVSIITQREVCHY